MGVWHWEKPPKKKYFNVFIGQVNFVYVDKQIPLTSLKLWMVTYLFNFLGDYLNLESERTNTIWIGSGILFNTNDYVLPQSLKYPVSVRM